MCRRVRYKVPARPQDNPRPRHPFQVAMPVKRLQAPEIFQKPIASVDTAGLPPRGSPGFGEALIARIAMAVMAKPEKHEYSRNFDMSTVGG